MHASSLNEDNAEEAFWSPAISLSPLQEHLMRDRNSHCCLDAAVSVFPSAPAAASSPLDSGYAGIGEPASSPGVENSMCSASTSYSWWGHEHGAVVKAEEALEDKHPADIDCRTRTRELETSTMQMHGITAPQRVGLEPITVRPLPTLSTPFGAARPASSLPACRFGFGSGNTASRQHLVTSSPLSMPAPRVWPQHDAQAWLHPDLHRSNIASRPTEDHGVRSGREFIKQPQQLKRRRSRSLPPDLGLDDGGIREQLLGAQRFSNSPTAPPARLQRAPVDTLPDFALPTRQASRSLPDLGSSVQLRRSLLPPCKVLLRQEGWHTGPTKPSSLSSGPLPQKQPSAGQSATLAPRMFPVDQRQGLATTDPLARALASHEHLAATHPGSVTGSYQRMSWQDEGGGPVSLGTIHPPARQGENDVQLGHTQQSVHIDVKAPVILEQKRQQEEGLLADGGNTMSSPVFQEFDGAANSYGDDMQTSDVIAVEDPIHLWHDTSLELPDLDAIGSDQDGNLEEPLNSSAKEDFLAFVSELGLF